MARLHDYDYIARPVSQRSSDCLRQTNDAEFDDECQKYVVSPYGSDSERASKVKKMFEDVIGTGKDAEWINDVHVFGGLGLMGSGKDYVLNNYVKRALSDANGDFCLTLSFAAALKRESVGKYGFTYETMYGRKTTASRLHAQRLGTEYGRNLYGLHVWIRHLLVEMRTHYRENGIRYFTIPDIRFPNELVILDGIFEHFVSLLILSHTRHEAALERESEGNPEKKAYIMAHVSEKLARDVDTSWIDVVFVNEPGADTYEDFLAEWSHVDISNTEEDEDAEDAWQRKCIVM